MGLFLLIIFAAFAIGFVVGQADANAQIKRKLQAMQHDPEFRERLIKSALEEIEKESPGTKSKWMLKIEEMQRIQAERTKATA